MKRYRDLDPDEIFPDASNLAGLDRDQFEGRIERALGTGPFVAMAGFMAAVLVAFLFRAGDLQLVRGAAYAEQARDNQLQQRPIIADRGELVDRNGVLLAYNSRAAITDEFAQRLYAPLRGLAAAVGYAKPPAKDSQGVYFREVFIGIDGAERAFDAELSGHNGVDLTETDVRGNIVSQSEEQPAQPGVKITLSLDSAVTQELYDSIASHAQSSNFQAGAGVIIDVKTGELVALTSYPEYSQSALEAGDSKAIAAFNADPRQPFLNRALNGLYAPGSIVKPFVAVGALTEGVIDEYKQILSTGSISVPNPFDAAHPSIFKDWRPQGWIDMRHAIAVSSDVYFYEVGGGFQDQPGLGIARLGSYLRMFGLGQNPNLAGFSEEQGTIPDPAWKELNFPGDPWRIGDTYHTAIGQYGVQVTPLQMARAAAALANGGTLLTPMLMASSTPASTILSLPQHSLQVAREGMRLGVTEGIAQALNFPFVQVAAKTGTAQVGVRNQFENSWVIGFFPYDHPRYAFAVVLDRGHSGTVVGAPAIMKTLLEWMQANAPQYLQ